MYRFNSTVQRSPYLIPSLKRNNYALIMKNFRGFETKLSPRQLQYYKGSAKIRNPVLQKLMGLTAPHPLLIEQYCLRL
ncbi:MAG: hypothetical protein SAL70_05145 [Scytonema sp. PMC 1070.18]|nr:hypothetical protein [Scytonema sp. PMC 1070.18]